jgi:hypothetical protein
MMMMMMIMPKITTIHWGILSTHSSCRCWCDTDNDSSHCHDGLQPQLLSGGLLPLSQQQILGQTTWKPYYFCCYCHVQDTWRLLLCSNCWAQSELRVWLLQLFYWCYECRSDGW